MIRQISIMVIAASLAACAVTQPLPPKLDLPPGAATKEQNELLEHWWIAFDDPVLNALVDEAFAGNLDLRGAIARIEAARASVLLAQSYLAPDIHGTGNGARQRISSVTQPPLVAGTQVISNDYRVSLDMSYEIDVWGKYRSGLLAARNDLAAAKYYRETVRIAVAAEVASTYFRLRAADAELVVLDETLAARIDSLRIARDRYDGGLIGDYDLKQAEAERSAVIADIARAKQAIGQYEAALAALTGRSPRAVFTPEIARGSSIEAVTSVPELPAGLPASLVERRPDIRRYESLLASSDLKIQKARADYFPAFTFAGSYGSETAILSKLFTSPATIWTLGLGVVQPLLALKAIQFAVEFAEATRDAAMVDFLQTVQTAFREVHDSLLVHNSAREILVAETDRRNDLAKALEMANLRYDAGRTSYLEVLDAQRTLLAAETLRIEAARDAKIAIVDFAKAIGGGWQTEQFALVE